MIRADIYHCDGCDSGYLALSGTSPFANDPLVRRKQVCYAGKFSKPLGGGRYQKFEITLPLMQHWANTSLAMTGNGVEIPTPKEHTEDSDDRRGTVLKFETGKDSKDRDSLFALVKFKDEDSLNKAKDSQVSIYVPEKVEDGKGNTYHAAIKHVAITDYPVIPDMTKFEPIAASLSTEEPPAPKGQNMRTIAKLLGIADDVADDKLEGEITKAIEALKEKSKGDGGEPKKDDVPPAVAASFIAQLKRGNDLELANLPQLNAGAREELGKVFNAEPVLALSLGKDQTVSKLFTGVVEAIKKLPKIEPNDGKSGPQVLDGLVLSDEFKKKAVGGLEASAQKMKDEHDKRNGK